LERGVLNRKFYVGKQKCGRLTAPFWNIGLQSKVGKKYFIDFAVSNDIAGICKSRAGLGIKFSI
jgi:hypothetical protein